MSDGISNFAFYFGVRTSIEWLNWFHCASQVNSDRIYWQKKPDGSVSQVHVEKNTIGQRISTKAVGSESRMDITHLYKYPEGNKANASGPDGYFSLFSCIFNNNNSTEPFQCIFMHI